MGKDANADVLIPLKSGQGVVHVVAGSGYTVLVLQDGSALMAGCVGSADDYTGHLGFILETVARGINSFLPVL